MSMHPFLANAYQTLSHAPAEGTEKVAAQQMLAKLAQADQLDLGKLSDADVQLVTKHYIDKQAEAPEGEMPYPMLPEAGEKKDEKDDKDKKDEKKDEKPEEKEAALTDREKVAAAELARADFTGRLIAHAMVDELGQIKQAEAAPQEQQVPEVYAKLAQARATQFLQEKVAAGQLCVCGDPACTGTCGTKEAAAEASQDDVINGLAVQMLQAEGYGHLLSQ